MYVYLSDEARALLVDLIDCGLYGESDQDVAETLILDQLKHLVGTPGWGRYFREKREARAAAERRGDDEVKAVPADADGNLPF